nr:MAG TPA: hypothetical protein [Caudoviricetes sp.]
MNAVVSSLDAFNFELIADCVAYPRAAARSL